MVAALFVGVTASVYLNEYARQGSFMNAIRLAILNLAGVPSIVFGLFGLMLFVFIAPKVTNVLAVRDSVRIPLWPSFSEPPVRQQVERDILIGEGKSGSEAMRLANAERAKTFWNGRWYLSFEGWGTSMLAGGFTLAVMVLPVIITACEESLRAVPRGYREASLALGSTKWQSIRTAVLPYAMPGILTASVLGITRVAGETAPIMFTAALAERSLLPWEGINRMGLGWLFDFLSQSVQALPYHIYTVAARIPQSEYTRPMQDGAVLVFMLFVMSFAGLSVWLRTRMRSKLKW
jgi:phosphate transport system permease protein